VNVRKEEKRLGERMEGRGGERIRSGVKGKEGEGNIAGKRRESGGGEGKRGWKEREERVWINRQNGRGGEDRADSVCVALYTVTHCTALYLSEIKLRMKA
jgi:hypothetical protein